MTPMLTLRRRLCLTTAVGPALLVTGGLQAQTLPTGSDVIRGAADITKAGDRIDINIRENATVINWRGFDLSQGATAVFTNGITGAPPAAVLNRVIGTSGGTPAASQINGTITASDSLAVYLVNPGGILFGRGAAVTTGSFVAAAHDLDPDSFRAGTFRFTGGTARGIEVDPNTRFTAHGLGTVTVGSRLASLGDLVLIGAKVAVRPASAPGDTRASFTSAGASGTIGNVALIAAQDVSLATTAGGLLSITVDQGTEVQGAFNVDAAVSGRNVTLTLASKAALTDTLFAGGTLQATGASISDRGVVLSAGGAAPGVTYTAGAVTGGSIASTASVLAGTRTVAITGLNDVSTTGPIQTTQPLPGALGNVTIAAGGHATVAGAVNAGGNLTVRAGQITLGAANTDPTQQAGGRIDLTATAGGITAIGAPKLIANSDNLDFTAAANRSIYLDAVNGPIALSGSSLTANNYAVSLRNTADPAVPRNVVLGDVTAAALNIADPGHTPSTSTSAQIAGGFTANRLELGGLTLGASGVISIGEVTATGPVSLSTTGSSDITLAKAIVTGAGLTVDAGGRAVMAGDVDVDGDYTVTGSSVTLGPNGPATQTAGGTVAITATSGLISTAPGAGSILTLRSDRNDLGDRPIMLTTQSTTPGSFAFLLGSRSHLQGGASGTSLVQLRSANAGSQVRLAQVTALGLQDYRALTSEYADGIVRSASIQTGNLVLGRAAILNSSSGSVVAGTIAAPSATLSGNQSVATGAITASAGSIVLRSGGLISASGALTTAAPTGTDILVDTSGTMQLSSLNAVRDVLIGQLIAPSSLTVNGALTARNVSVSTTSGTQGYNGTITARGETQLRSGATGTIRVGTLNGTNFVSINGGQVSATSVQGRSLAVSSAIDTQLGAVTTTSGGALVTATGNASVTGTVSVTGGDYIVAGASVTVGRAGSPVLQSADGAVSLTATGGTLTGVAGTTLQANRDDLYADALTLATNGSTGGDILFAGITLLGGASRSGAVQIRSRTADNLVTLGTIRAASLLGDVAGQGLETGLVRTGALSMGSIDVAGDLLLGSGSTITAADLAGAGVTLTSVGRLQIDSATARSGALTIGGSGDVAVTAAGLSAITGAIGIDRGAAAISVTGLNAGGGITIGTGSVAATSVTTNGTVASGGAIDITTSGKQSYGGAVTGTSATTLSGSAIQLTGLTSGGAVTLSSSGLLSAQSISGGSVTLVGAGAAQLTRAAGITATGGDIVIARGGALNLTALNASGNIAVGQSVSTPTLIASGTINAGGTIDVTTSATQSYSGAITSTAAARLSGGGLQIAGINAGGAVQLASNGLIDAGFIRGSGVSLIGSGDVNVTGAAGVVATASDVVVDRVGAITVTAIDAARDVAIGRAILAASFSASGTVTAGRTIDVAASGTQRNAGTISSVGGVQLSGAALQLASLSAGGDTRLATDGLLSAASITGAKVSLTGAGDLSVTGPGGITATAGNISIDRRGALSLTSLQASGDIAIGQSGAAASLAVSGTVSAGSSIRVATTGSQSYAGAVASTNAAQLSGSTLLLSSLSAGGAAQLASTGLIDARSISGGSVTLTGTGDVRVTGSGGIAATIDDLLIDRDGAVAATAMQATRDLLIGESVANASLATGTVTAGRNVSITSNGAILVAGGVDAGADAALRGSGIDLSHLVSGGSALVSASSRGVAIGGFTSGGGANVTATGDVAVVGAVDVTGDYRIAGASVNLGNGASAVTQTATGNVDITARSGAITGAAGLTLRADGAGNGRGTLVLDGATGIGFDATSRLEGGTTRSGNIGIRAGGLSAVTLGAVSAHRLTGAGAGASHILDNRLDVGGSLILAGNVDAVGSLVVSSGGTMQMASISVASGDLVLTSASNEDLITSGPLSAYGAVSLTAGRRLAFASVEAGGDAFMTAGTTLTGGALSTGGTARATSNGALSLTTLNAGTGGRISGSTVTLGTAESLAGQLNLSSREGAILADRVGSGGALDIATGGNVGIGSIIAGADLTINANAVGGRAAGSRTMLNVGGNMRVTTSGAVLGADMNVGGLMEVGASHLDASRISADGADLTIRNDVRIGTITTNSGMLHIAAGGQLGVQTLVSGGGAVLQGTDFTLGSGSVTGAAQIVATTGTAGIVDIAADTIVIDSAADTMIGSATGSTITAIAGGALSAATMTARNGLFIRAATLDVDTARSEAGTASLVTTTGQMNLTHAFGGAGLSLDSAEALAVDMAASGGSATLTVDTASIGGRSRSRADLVAGGMLRLETQDAALLGTVSAGLGAALTAGTLDLTVLDASDTAITATAGSLHSGAIVTTGSALLLANKGTITAGAIDAAAIELSGGAIDVGKLGGGTIDLHSASSLRLRSASATSNALFTSTGDLDLDTIHSGGALTFAGDTVRIGAASSTGALSGDAGTIIADSLSGGAVTLTTRSSPLAVTHIRAAGNAMLSSAGDAAFTTIAADTSLTLDASGTVSMVKANAGGALTLRGAAIDAGAIRGDSISARTATGSLRVAAAESSRNATFVSAGDLELDTAASGGDLNFAADGAARITRAISTATLSGEAGTIIADTLSGGAVSLNATSGPLAIVNLRATDDAVLTSASDASFTTIASNGALTLDAGGVVSGIDATAAGALSITGSAIKADAMSGDGITLAARTGALGVRDLRSGGDATLTSAGDIDVDDVSSGGTISVTAASTAHISGTVNAVRYAVRGGEVMLGGSGTSILQSAAEGVHVIATQGGISGLSGLVLQSDAAGTGNGDLILDSARAIDFAPNTRILGGSGQTAAVRIRVGNGETARLNGIDARTLLSVAAPSDGDLDLVGSLDVHRLAIGNDATIRISGGGANFGSVTAGGNFGLTTDGAVTAAIISGGGAVALRAESIAIGAVGGGGDILLRSAGDMRVDSATGHGGDLTLSAGKNIHATDGVSGSAIMAAGDVVLDAGAAAVLSRADAGETLTVRANSIVIGNARSGGAMHLSAGVGDLRAGTATADGSATLDSAGRLSMGTLTVAGNASLTGRGATLGDVRAGSALTVITGADPLNASSITAGTLRATSGGALDIMNLTTAGGDALLTATGAAAVRGTASIAGDYRVQAAQVTLGVEQASVSQGAAGLVTVIADRGAVEGLGALSIASGAGALTLRAKGAEGTVTLDAASRLEGRNGGVDVATSGIATLGRIDAEDHSIFITAADVALNGLVSGASVSLVNSMPTQAVRLGDTPVAGSTEFNAAGSRFSVSAAEFARIEAPMLIVDAGGALRIGDLSLASGTGSTRVAFQTTNRIDVLGRIATPGAGIDRTVVLGGTGAASDMASVIRVAATGAGGGRLILDGGTLDLRGRSIGVGFDEGFLSAIDLVGKSPISGAEANANYVSQLGSTLYDASAGTSASYADPVTILSGRMIVRYDNFALFQNTGQNGATGGILLGTAGDNRTLQLYPVGTANAFALSGTINGAPGSAAASLGTGVLVLGDGAVSASTRINGCLIGLSGSCLGSPIVPPRPASFDVSRGEIIRTGADLARAQDSFVTTEYEHLFGSDDRSDAEDRCGTSDEPSCLVY